MGTVLERLGEWEMGGNIFVCMHRHGEGLVLASRAQVVSLGSAAIAMIYIPLEPLGVPLRLRISFAHPLPPLRHHCARGRTLVSPGRRQNADGLVVS